MFSIKSPKRYLQLPGICARAGELISPLSTHVFIISSPAAWRAVNPELEKSLSAAGIRFELALLTSECTEAAIAELTAQILHQGASLVLGIGGGRVLDAAKAAGNAVEKVAVVTLPTLAATCAAWSPLSILYTADGAHQRSQPLQRMPELVLVDSEVIARSDVRYLKAGIVDALAKWYEFQPYQQKNPDNLALNLKALMARQAVELFEKWGAQAVQDNQHGRVTLALNKVIEGCIVLAGMANSIRDADPTPGFAHAIHNRLTRQPELHDWLHGEKVGFSLLVQSLMQQPDGKPEAGLLALLRQYGAPLTLAPLTGDRHQAIGAIAREVKFSAENATRLPFDTSAGALEKALLATEIG
ncbi:iron-containing alcohol dehydrogenase family protein [Erwinia pyri]|uniref:Iron-containing alcohol dehydrogenase family protein n=1 Tax=Erwinia pyri TaxID=3062598 RepID=A0AA50HLS6_9GAMM|nr:iron-containing alcohol dehydrogenase family protein [Erwinia sp. DE2]WLS79518.1 iron-containing alcohol dehydrogenase family protein [Erwinia sp. DE2]